MTSLCSALKPFAHESRRFANFEKEARNIDAVYPLMSIRILIKVLQSKSEDAISRAFIAVMNDMVACSQEHLTSPLKSAYTSWRKASDDVAFALRKIAIREILHNKSK
jgi:hypothetical protein